MTLSGMIKKLKASEDKLVTPRIMEYLTTTKGNVDLDDWVVERVSELLKDNSNSVRHSRFGASSRGTCHRQQVYTYLGRDRQFSYDPILNNIFQDGTWRHIRWQAMGLQTGLFTAVETKYQRGEISVSLDGENKDEGWIFELKGAWRIPEAIPEEHLLQIHTYFYATGYEKCSYLVENKQTQDWREWVVTPVPSYMRAVKEEINALTHSVEKEELPEILPACRQKEGPYKKCPYSSFCLDDEGWPS